MSSIARTNIFTNGTPPTPFQIESEVQNIVDTWNNHDQGRSYWSKVNTFGPIRIGLSAVSGFTATAAAGGTLANGTYYYKVFSFDSNNRSGIPSVEKSVVLAGANGTVNLSWTAVSGASYYRIQRGTQQGGGGGVFGYFQTTAVSFVDSGQALDAGSVGAIDNDQNAGAIVASGTIDIPSSVGAIRWYNYTDGLIGGSVSCTSAGEMDFKTGKGSAQGNYIFLNENEAQRIVFQTTSTSPVISFTGTGVVAGVIEASPLIFSIGGAERVRFSSTLVTASIPLQETSTAAADLRNLIYVNNATGDPFWNFATNATNWSVGIDNSDTDAFVITQNNTLDGTNYFKITTAGQVQLGTGTSAVNVRINSQTGGGVGLGTLTNAPSAGDPAVWIKVDINGTTRQIPAW